MDCDSYMVDENELTFDLDEWMTQLKADDQCHYSPVMEAAGPSFTSANANEHRNDEKADEKFWSKTESKSDLFSGMCQTPMSTSSDSDNFSGLARMGMFPTNSPMVKTELSATQFLQQTAPELKLRQMVKESVFQHSPNQSNIYYQSQQEPLIQLQTSQQYMSTSTTSERLKVSIPSTLPLRQEASEANSVIGSSTRQLDMLENLNKFLMQTYVGLDSDEQIKPESMISQQNLQQVQPPMQFYHHLDAQNLRNELSHGMQQKIQANSHSQGLIIGGQLKPNQFPQRMPYESSSASINMAQNGILFSNFAEWQDPAYSQLLTMKQLYLSEVMGVYQRCQASQPSNAEFAIRLEKIRNYVERVIKFLNMPKSDLVHYSKERIYNYMKQVTVFIYQNRGKHYVPSQYHHPIAQPPRLLQNRNFQFNMHNGGSAAIGPNRFAKGTGLANGRAGSSYLSNQSSLPAVPKLANNLSQGWFKPRAPDLLQPCSTGLRHHNALSASLMNSSPNEILGACGFATRADPLDFTVIQSQNPRNCEDRQFMQTNKIQQRHHPLIDQHKQHTIVLRTSENNDSRFGDTMCFSPTKVQQPCQEETSQHINHFSQTVLSSNSCQPHVAPLQSGQCSSPRVDSNDFSSKVSKVSITLQSTGSPFVVPSPLTPLTPLSSMEDQVKKSSVHSPSLISGEDFQELVLQNEPQAEDSNYGAPDVLEVDNSHLPPQVESEEVQESNAERGPLKRLLKVVKSSSQKALNSALQEICAVTNMIDRRAGSALAGESRYILNHDLADEIQYSWKDDDLLNLEYEVLPSSSCASESFSHLSGESLNSESMASSQSKRLKTEEKNLLVKEIEEVNRCLVESVAEMVMVKTGFSAYEADEETIIQCSYLPVGQFATSHMGFPGLLLKLLVNRDYPHSSPSVLDVKPYKCSETEEVQAITQKAKSKYSLSLRKFSEPMSVSMMVKAWDVSAREVYHECAKKFGGECFSSRYGGWKGCVTAA